MIAGRPDSHTILERSCFVSETWEHPPASDPRALAEALETFCKTRLDVGLVYPVGDTEINLTARLAVRLPVLVVAASSAILDVCRCKRLLLGLAAEAGVPTLDWVAIDQREAIAPAVGRIGLPAALKPDITSEGVVGFKASIIRTEADAQRIARQTTFPECGFVLQRLAHGPRHNIYFVAHEGRLLGSSEIRILRTDRLDGTGLAVEGESVSPDAALLKWTEALVKRLSYTGAGCAQFLVDESAGTASFLEINARLGANCAAVCACGLDLPRLFVEALLGTAVQQPPAQVGRRYAWLSGDLNGLATSLRSGKQTWSGAAAWLGRAALAQLRADDHITWSWRDPLPTLAIFGSFFQAGARKLSRSFIPRRERSSMGTFEHDENDKNIRAGNSTSPNVRPGAESP
jgi:hypothetical protein